MPLRDHLCCNADDTASRSGASITSLLGFLALTLTEIICASVNDDSSAENTLLADQLNMRVADGALAISLFVCLEIAQVSNVTNFIRWGAVCLAMWVEVGTSRCAAIGVVAILVDVHSSLSVCIIATDVICDCGGRGLGGLLECDSTGDFRVSSEDGNCFDHFDG